MKSPRLFVALFSASLFLTAGCAHRTYTYAYAPPPPPAYSVPPLIERANHEGFRFGMADASRDAYRGFGYQPKRSPAFRDTPGYDPALGPYGPYRDAFRTAYLRGYDQGFPRR
jgi:hypothetical protein